MIDIMVFTYNNEAIVHRCLNSIKNQSYKKFSCIVIDDNSTDKTIEIIKKKYSWVKVYKKERNTGPAESRNIGIRKTRNKYIAMLDSDVELSKDWLEKQIKVMDSDKSIGIVGSKLLYTSNHKIDNAGGCITRLGFGFDRGRGKNANLYREQEQMSYACSAAWLMRRSLINKTGLFDESFFYPHEDTDFCWRALIAEYKIIYNPSAVAYHLVGSTTKKMGKRVAYHVTKNRIRSILKNYELKNILLYLPLHMMLIFLDIIFRGNRIAKIKGLLWNFVNINDTIKMRKRVQKNRVVSDKELMTIFTKKWMNEKI